MVAGTPLAISALLLGAFLVISSVQGPPDEKRRHAAPQPAAPKPLRAPASKPAPTTTPEASPLPEKPRGAVAPLHRGAGR